MLVRNEDSNLVSSEKLPSEEIIYYRESKYAVDDVEVCDTALERLFGEIAPAQSYYTYTLYGSSSIGSAGLDRVRTYADTKSSTNDLLNPNSAWYVEHKDIETGRKQRQVVPSLRVAMSGLSAPIVWTNTVNQVEYSVLLVEGTRSCYSNSSLRVTIDAERNYYITNRELVEPIFIGSAPNVIFEIKSLVPGVNGDDSVCDILVNKLSDNWQQEIILRLVNEAIHKS